jgi:hypothetical protein
LVPKSRPLGSTCAGARARAIVVLVNVVTLARDRRIAMVVLILASVMVVAALLGLFGSEQPLPSLEDQACSLPGQWLELTRRGYFAPRSGQISLLPRYPAYFAQSGTGWTHSGPWPHLQKVPIVFYGPGVIPKVGEVARRATVADIAPTIMTLLRGSFRTPPARGCEWQRQAARVQASEADPYRGVGRGWLECIAAVA